MKAQSLMSGVIILVTCLLAAATASGQPSKGAGGAGAGAGGQQSSSSQAVATPSTSSSTASGGGSLPGLSYARDDWDTLLGKPDFTVLGLRKSTDVVFVCYKLVPGFSATQPLILEPVSMPLGTWKSGQIYYSGQTIKGPPGHYYEYTVRSGGTSHFPVDGINSPNIGPRVDDTEYLQWEDLGPDDSPQSHMPWQEFHEYTQNSVVVPPIKRNGHMYKAVISSRATKGSIPDFANVSNYIVDRGTGAKYIADSMDANNTFYWKDLGLSVDPHIDATCSNITPTSPLLMDQILVVAVDMSEIPEQTNERFKLLNLNITNQQGTSLNPTPIRPSVAAGTASGPAISGPGFAGTRATQKVSNLQHDAYYLTWPNQLPGDVIPTVSVNLVYTPVAPGLEWVANTFYPAGSIVISNNNGKTNGHYYIALNSGISSVATPAFNAADSVVPVETFTDGPGVIWKDMGPPTATTSPTPIPWAPTSPFSKDQNVIPRTANGHYYQAQSTGTSGVIDPNFPTDGKSTIIDGSTLTWTIGGPIPYKTPLDQWASSHTYYPGNQVIPQGGGNGHYYQAVLPGIQSGTAGTTQPAFTTDGRNDPDNGPLSWQDMGLINKPQWQAGTAYAKGNTVVPSSATGYFYVATVAGVSGPNAPAFPTDPSASVAEGTNLVWLDAGTTQPASIKNLKAWAPYTAYFYGDGILDPVSGHYYTALQAGMSGLNPPSLFVPAPARVAANDKVGQWQDLGTTLPASVSIGTPPSDQTVNLLNYTYAQAHALSRFNLASGVVFDFIKPPQIVNNGSTSSPNYASTPGTPQIDAILAVTVYFKPMDAERQFHKSDLIPGASVGFSLTAPSSNFYFGGSSELFIRNLQAIYGVGALKLTALGPSVTSTATPPVTTVPATVQKEYIRGFVGVSFNITGFLQSLF